ncbi:uncharacterized protein LOC120352315, partial [Nilaparvata lugens]|uniref:uncharacterized protein LOC120352315 n=1 Tax=Nilaparvata lugens TaxID=108931 RepID=UPI00193CE7D2
MNAWQCGEGENSFLRVVNQFKALPEKMKSIEKIVYHDGVTLIKKEGAANFDFEIQEVKYISGPDALKFSGKLRFAEGDGAITPISTPGEGESLLALNQPSSLQLLELYKTNFGQGGIIVEIQRTCVPIFIPVKCEHEPNRDTGKQLRG